MESLYIQKAEENKEFTINLEKLDNISLLILESTIFEIDIENLPTEYTQYVSVTELLESQNIKNDSKNNLLKKISENFLDQTNSKVYKNGKPTSKIVDLVSKIGLASNNMLFVEFNDSILPYMKDLKENLKKINKKSDKKNINMNVKLPSYNPKEKIKNYTFTLSENEREMLSKVSKAQGYTSDSRFLGDLIMSLDNE